MYEKIENSENFGEDGAGPTSPCTSGRSPFDFDYSTNTSPHGAFPTPQTGTANVKKYDPATCLANLKEVNATGKGIRYAKELWVAQCAARQAGRYNASLAGLLLLCLDIGLLKEKKIASAIQADEFTSLYTVAITSLFTWLKGTSAAIFQGKEETYYDMEVSLADEDILSNNDQSSGGLLLRTYQACLTFLELGSLPVPLAVALALTMDLLGKMLPLASGRDIFNYGSYEDKRLNFYHDLREKGYLKDKDPQALIDYIERIGPVGYSDLFGDLPCKEEAKEILETAEMWTQPMPKWEAQYKAKKNKQPLNIAQNLLNQLARWRRSQPTLYVHPLTAFIHTTATLYREHHQRHAQLLNQDSPWWFPDGYHPLNMSLPLSLGYPWEEEIYQVMYEGIACGGEPFMEGLSLDPAFIPNTRETLRSIAEGFGLLTWLDHLLRHCTFEETGDDGSGGKTS